MSTDQDLDPAVRQHLRLEAFEVRNMNREERTVTNELRVCRASLT